MKWRRDSKSVNYSHLDRHSIAANWCHRSRRIHRSILDCFQPMRKFAARRASENGWIGYQTTVDRGPPWYTIWMHSKRTCDNVSWDLANRRKKLPEFERRPNGFRLLRGFFAFFSIQFIGRRFAATSWCGVSVGRAWQTNHIVLKFEGSMNKKK